MYKLLLCLLVASSCAKKVNLTPDPPPATPLAIKAVDASMLPEIASYGLTFKNKNGQAENMLTTLRNAGVNTIRVRLWKDPATPYSGFASVQQFVQQIRREGLKVWLTVHYADTWADPGAQPTPAAWSNLGFTALKDSVYAYTSNIVTTMQPDYIQIGNEINGGFLWPEGNYSNMTQLKSLLSEGIRAVRTMRPATKIMLHYAGITGAASFFANFSALDYDIAAISYYPIWHGKDMNLVQETVSQLGTQFNKDVVIAETAYPFTLDWKDYTNNIIGLSEQLLPAYAPTPAGQRDYLQRIKTIMVNAPRGIGFCYWGADWVAFKGATATNGSSWENQALWDFNLQALPAMDAFAD